jgi:predicted membrane-bound spermidine synthase/tetratricopeptide (TPR) repeat protein
MLTLTFGHTVYSASIVLCAFMAGLGLGAYLWGHWADTVKDPLLVYGKIEILIALLGTIISFVIANFGPFYSWLNVFIPEVPFAQNLVKAILAFFMVMLPAMLMGATLPIVSKYYVVEDEKIGTQIGLLYSINTLGAALGCLLTGYLLIPQLGVLQAVLFGACLNLLVGLGAVRVYEEANPEEKIDYKLPWPKFPKFVVEADDKTWLAVSFLSGFTALAFQVLWTRLLVFSISSTVYAFSMMLAVFLLGIVIGSFLVITILKLFSATRTILAVLQAGVGIYAISSLFMIEDIMSAPWNSYNLQNPVAAFITYFKDSSALILIPTILLGMCFPILTKNLAKKKDKVGSGAGQIYAVNTLGAILGSFIAGFILLPMLGSQKSIAVIASLNLLCAVFLFSTGDRLQPVIKKPLFTIGAVLIIALNFFIPKDLIDSFFMRDSSGRQDVTKLIYFDEGLTDTVAIFKDKFGILDPEAKRLITNGISMSASNMTATKYMKMLAHVPIILRDNPKDVLVICFGTGQTVGAAGIHPEVEKIDAVELSPGVINSGKVFAKENHNALENPKINIVFQDGRNHLLMTGKSYDVITAEPPPPRTAFTVNLYTREYYELAKKRIKPGGIVAQWIPLHSQSAEEVKRHFKTFRDVFPHSIAWMSVAKEILIIGSDQPIEIDFEKVKNRLANPKLETAFKELEIDNPYAFLSSIWMFEDGIDKLAMGRPIISDNHPSIEFYLDFPDIIGPEELEKIIFNRASLDEIVKRIKNFPKEGRAKFEPYYRSVDLYQRGVIYGNPNLLLEATNLTSENELFRFHLQASRNQIKRLLDLIKKEPKNPVHLLNLGHSYFQLGKFKESTDLFRKAKRLDSSQHLADLYMAHNFLKTGKLKKAKIFFETVAKNDPRFIRNIMQEIGLIELLTQLEGDPENQGLMISTAQYFNMRNNFRKALTYSLKVLEKSPDNINALQSAVISYRGLGEPREALVYGVRYSVAKPDDIEGQYVVAELFMNTLNYKKAKLYLERILRKNDSYQNAEQLLEECIRAEVITKDAA